MLEARGPSKPLAAGSGWGAAHAADIAWEAIFAPQPPGNHPKRMYALPYAYI